MSKKIHEYKYKMDSIVITCTKFEINLFIFKLYLRILITKFIIGSKNDTRQIDRNNRDSRERKTVMNLIMN